MPDDLIAGAARAPRGRRGRARRRRRLTSSSTRMAASGVRSSCEASATRRSRASTPRSSRSSIALSVRARWPSSSLDARDGDPLARDRSIGRSRRRGSVMRSTGRSARAREPSSRRASTSSQRRRSRASEQEHERRGGARCVDLVQRFGASTSARTAPSAPAGTADDADRVAPAGRGVATGHPPAGEDARQRRRLQQRRPGQRVALGAARRGRRAPATWAPAPRSPGTGSTVRVTSRNSAGPSAW